MTRTAREILAAARALALELERLERNPWVGLRQAAAELGVPRRTLAWRCAHGKVPGAVLRADGWLIPMKWVATEAIATVVAEAGNAGNSRVREVG